MKKILFYGNCQLGAIARFFRRNLSNVFDVQLCTDCGLQPFWDESGLFAVWSPENKTNQIIYKQAVLSKIAESDVFVFQDHSGNSVIEELQTKYIHDNIAKNIKICMPDVRFFAHLTDPRILLPYINYVKTKSTDPEQIIHYLQCSDDPHLTQILKNDYPFKKEFERYRNENTFRSEENSKMYDISIDICDFLENEFQNKLLCVSHNHMNELYFKELLQRLFNVLNIDSSVYPIRDIQYPLFDSLDPRQFTFFNKTFPNINYENFKGRKLRPSDII
jgi:hypothetical protein